MSRDDGHWRLTTRTDSICAAQVVLTTNAYTGTSLAPEMMPRIHEPAPGVTAAPGFSGRGIAMTSVMGTALARKVLGEPQSTLPFPAVPLKPIVMHAPLKSLIPLAAPVMSIKDGLDRRFDGLCATLWAGAAGTAGDALRHDEALTRRSRHRLPSNRDG